MLKNNKIKNHKLILSLFVIVIFLVNMIIASNCCHTAFCQMEGCNECTLIYNAQSLLEKLVLIQIVILSICISLLSAEKITFVIKSIKGNTLVNFKVQFNE